LMSFSSDMPIQIRSRSQNVAGMLNLMTESGINSVYRKLGIDFDKLGDVTKQLTGEMAGGMNISSSGFATKFIYILKPGVDGNAFISNTYLPWLENYSSQVLNLASQQNGAPPVKVYKRTTDSTVAGVKVRGVKADFGAILPPEAQNNVTLKKLAVEIRLAAIGDLMLLAPSDAQLEDLINKSRALKSSPAQGPVILADVNLGALIKGIQSLMPSTGKPFALPEDLGNITISGDMDKGKLATRTSFNIDLLRKLSAVMKQASAAAVANAGKTAAK
jgi:hypothetical protein